MSTYRSRTLYLMSCGMAVALSIGAMIAGCNRDSTTSSNNGNSNTTTTQATRKLAFVTNNASDYWKTAAAGVHKYEKESGVTVDIKLPPNGKVEEQNQMLEELVSQGYDGIAVSVIAPEDQIGEMNRAAAKCNVICFDSDCPKSNRLCYIGTNNVVAGNRRWGSRS